MSKDWKPEFIKYKEWRPPGKDPAAGFAILAIVVLLLVLIRFLA